MIAFCPAKCTSKSKIYIIFDSSSSVASIKSTQSAVLGRSKYKVMAKYARGLVRCALAVQSRLCTIGRESHFRFQHTGPQHA